jgi:hypothetical protein
VTVIKPLFVHRYRPRSLTLHPTSTQASWFMWLVKSLVMDLEQHLIGEVIEAAAKPLFAKVEAAMASLDWSASGSGGSPRPPEQERHI